MSGSEDSVSIPSATTLTNALREAVKRVFRTSDLTGLTVKRIRAATEKELNLPEGFFKDSPDWKTKSKEIVEAAADVQYALQESGEADKTRSVPKKTTAPKANPISVAKAGPAPKKSETEGAKRGTKRSSTANQSKPHKRQKSESPISSELSELTPSASEQDEPPKQKITQTKLSSKNANANVKMKKGASDEQGEESPQKTKPRRSQQRVLSDSGDDAETIAVTSKPIPIAKEIKGTRRLDGSISSQAVGPNDNSQLKDRTEDVPESELSVLIDEEPKRKRKKVSSNAQSPKKSKTSSSGAKFKASTASKDDGTPEGEIKSLQSWLLKCGIRKVWSRELAPYSTSSAKISHLKQMLKDAGMKGRFSAEKARQIKEDRELKAELEAVQDGARRWGEDGEDDEDEDNKAKPRRRLARGLRELDFLGSDGEETD